jgi:hypothetical protein
MTGINSVSVLVDAVHCAEGWLNGVPWCRRFRASPSEAAVPATTADCAGRPAGPNRPLPCTPLAPADALSGWHVAHRHLVASAVRSTSSPGRPGTTRPETFAPRGWQRIPPRAKAVRGSLSPRR